MVSGDGCNERYDTITQGFPHYVMCVDDTMMWAKDVKESFLQMCNYLDLCARHGIVLNPSRFQFCKDTVTFAGLQVSSNSVQLQSIADLPPHKDISGARAWFGLVNQGSYTFSMTEEMATFRHLLKLKTKFEWTQELEKAFQISKMNIGEKIKQGVEMFDPSFPTYIATDFSGTGLGFFLLQKTCGCDSNHS